MTSAALQPLTTLCNCDRLSAVPEYHWPKILSAHIDLDSATIKMNISPELHWFNGHFPDQPVLPGVVQTHWACLLASTVFNVPNEFSALTRLKFNAPVLPGQPLLLELAHNRARSRVSYRYHEDGCAFSSGTLHFDHPAI